MWVQDHGVEAGVALVTITYSRLLRGVALPVCTTLGSEGQEVHVSEVEGTLTRGHNKSPIELTLYLSPGKCGHHVLKDKQVRR